MASLFVCLFFGNIHLLIIQFLAQQLFLNKIFVFFFFFFFWNVGENVKKLPKRLCQNNDPHSANNFFPKRFYHRCLTGIWIRFWLLSIFLHEQIGNYDCNRAQKNIGTIAEVKKSCNDKWNINGIYNKKRPYNCLHQLPTLGIKT